MEYARAMPHLTIQSGIGAPQEHPLEGDLITVGRNSDNNIVVDDESVSGHHAEISTTDGLYTLRDLQSSNGMTVNGVPATETMIHDGDVICFGGVECRFHNRSVSEESEPSEPHPAPHAQPESAMEAEPHPSFGSKLASFGKAALGEAQRNARLAALKTRIEKLKLVDLNKAHYALGKKGYELKIRPESFGSLYHESAEIEQSIVTNRAGVTTADNATAMQKVKGVAVSTGMKAEAERLNLKLKQHFVTLGQDIDQAGGAPELASEMEELASIKSRIEEIEKEYVATSADHVAQDKLKSLSASLASDTGARSRLAWKRGAHLLLGRRRTGLIIFAAVLILGVTVFTFMHKGKRGPSYEKGGPETAASLHDDEITPASQVADPLPFDYDRAKRGLTASGFHFVDADYAENPNKTVFIAFTRRGEKLVSIELSRLIRIDAGRMDEFVQSSQALSDAASAAVGVFLTKDAWLDIAGWHYEPVQTGEWFQRKEVVSRSRAGKGFFMQSVWRHWNSKEGERGRETLFFTGLPPMGDAAHLSEDSRIREARIDAILKRTTRRITPTANMSWFTSDNMETFQVYAGEVPFYIAKLHLDDRGKWAIVIPITEGMSPSEKNQWKDIFKRITNEFTGVNCWEVLIRGKIEEKNPVINGWYFSVLDKGKTPCFMFAPPEFITGH